LNSEEWEIDRKTNS